MALESITRYKAHIAFGLVSCVCIAMGYFGTRMTADAHEKINDMLRDMSSFVFAVSGLWVGLFCPKALDILCNKSLSAEIRRSELGSVTEIFQPIFISVILLLMTIVHSISVPVVKALCVSSGCSYGLKWMGFSIALSMSSMLIYALYLTCKPGLVLVMSADKGVNAQEKSERRACLRPPNPPSEVE